MAIQEGTALSGVDAGTITDRDLYLVGSDSSRPVRCTTRWMDERHAYVVAPLATAKAAEQRWEALTAPPAGGGRSSTRRRLSVELISANALLGPDSGKEGLLLRYFEGKAS